VAYHETGHALTTLLFNDMFTLQKVTINSNKNGAGGYTLFTPIEQYNEYPTKKFLLARMIIALGGRAAEVVLYDKTYNVTQRYLPNIVFPNVNQLDVTTGASNDLKQANDIARKYVSLFGLGKNIGLYDTTDTSQPFLGRNIATNTDKLSDYSKESIDKEIQNLVDFSYKKAVEIIHRNEDSFHLIAQNLLQNKTVSGFDMNTYDISFK